MPGPLITFREIAVVSGRKAADLQAEAVELQMFVETDWAGRPCLTAGAAKALISGEQRAVLEHEARWRDHLAAEKRWVKDRNRVMTEAAEKQNAKHTGQHYDGESWARANEASVKAAKAYERSTPRPKWKAK